MTSPFTYTSVHGSGVFVAPEVHAEDPEKVLPGGLVLALTKEDGSLRAGHGIPRSTVVGLRDYLDNWLAATAS